MQEEVPQLSSVRGLHPVLQVPGQVGGITGVGTPTGTQQDPFVPQPRSGQVRSPRYVSPEVQPMEGSLHQLVGMQSAAGAGVGNKSRRVEE
ncbi:MAG: hypothetical protein G01um101416_280 [Microgenomates group bacterium Gr01-1014_16]|nr:MAG: hypothetical protein G01um101416_280 [Microgenomates group bacterium Gr01-1014_16]